MEMGQRQVVRFKAFSQDTSSLEELIEKLKDSYGASRLDFKNGPQPTDQGDYMLYVRVLEES